MKRILFLSALVLIALGFLSTLVFLYQRSQPEPVVYETSDAFLGDIVKKTVATGAIVPRREVAIKPRVSGILEELLVDAGDKLEAGDLIARIRIVPNVVNLNSAESAVEAARINLQNAERERDRFQKLLGQSLVAEAEFARIDYELQLRKQEFAAAQSNLQLIRSGASKKTGKVSNTVRSTLAGMVTEVPVKEGVSVTETNNFNEGTTVATVADMSDMIFQGRVDESEVGKLKPGMELDIKIGAIDDQRFKGKLEYIAPKGIEYEGAIQFEIRAALDRSDGAFIRANYSANADIVLGRRENVVAIQESVLQFDKENKPFVEVETGTQTFERRDVEVGLSDGINIEILSGIDEDSIIKKPQQTDEPEAAAHTGPRKTRQRG